MLIKVYFNTSHFYNEFSSSMIPDCVRLELVTVRISKNMYFFPVSQHTVIRKVDKIVYSCTEIKTKYFFIITGVYFAMDIEANSILFRILPVKVDMVNTKLYFKILSYHIKNRRFQRDTE